MEPTLHKPVPMGTEVIIPEHYVAGGRKGKVVGVAFIHVVFGYIVLIEGDPVTTPEGLVQAIVVNGPELVGPDGKNWRLDG